MKVTRNLLDSLPLGKKNIILDKIMSFEKALLDCRAFTNLPKGFWVRKVAGTDVYKFRVSNGDRILFKYEKIDGQEAILYLNYCNHDNQIRTAKQYTGLPFLDYEVDKNVYAEDEFDKKIDQYVKSNVYAKLEEIKNELITEDDFISLYVEENELLPFLSLEQFECIATIDQPILVLGCAGSGKTMVSIRRLVLNSELSINTLYLTSSKYIISRTSEIYHDFCSNSEFVHFFTFRELCCSMLNLKDQIIIGFEDFHQWVTKANLLHPAIDSREIWLEISTIIKGRYVSDSSVLNQEQYFSDKDSHFDNKQKKIVYDITCLYNNWLRANNYYDDNDLAFLANKDVLTQYDYVIYDEIEDLTERQLKLVIALSKNRKGLMLLGDLDQSINVIRFNISLLKTSIFTQDTKLVEKYITKNYRSGSETIRFINALKQIKWDKFKIINRNLMEPEQSIKDGGKPYVIYKVKQEQVLFQKIDTDANSIIIVADETDREKLKKKGYSPGRIFTVQDTRGLEYDNVYCFNMMTKFKRIWNLVLVNYNKYDDFYKIYFNLIYIAITRAKQKVFFVEDEVTQLANRLAGHWELIDESLLLEGMTGASDTLDWLDEARRLEKLEKYEQAAEAYKKAGNFAEADLCLTAYERNLNFNNLQDSASYVEITSMQEITAKLLETILTEICSRYKVHLGKSIEVGVTFKNLQGGRRAPLHLTNTTCANIARSIVDVMNDEAISPYNVTIKTFYYRSGTQANASCTHRGIPDLSIVANHDQLEFDSICSQSRVKNLLNNHAESLHIKHLKAIGVENMSIIERLRYDKKYETKTAAEILDYIWRGK